MGRMHLAEDPDDVKVFATWMIENNLQVENLQRSDLIAYRVYLGSTYQMATAAGW